MSSSAAMIPLHHKNQQKSDGACLLFALLCTTTQAQHKVESALFLNVVVGKRAAILELLACKDEALLVRRDAFFVLDL